MDFDEDMIATLMRANRRLLRQASRLENVFNAICEAIIVADPDGITRYANAAAKKMFTLLREQPHANISKIIPEIDAVNLRATADGLSARREFEITYPERRFIKVYMVPFGDLENSAIALIISDITQEKLSTEELIESEKISSVLKLASGVAHELGNPLNSMSIHLQLASRDLKKIADSPEKSKLKNSLDVCSAEVVRLDGIIKNFLKALRPARPNFAEINPLLPLAETIKFLQTELQDLEITVEIESKAALPTMMGDADLLKQLYFNIIKNSMEAMDGGGVIKISSSFNDNLITILIRDTGCGIDQEHIARIFEPYFTTKEDGHGLGMMIVYEIAKSHGARISVDSKVNEGATISLSFPRKERRIREIEAS